MPLLLVLILLVLLAPLPLLKMQLLLSSATDGNTNNTNSNTMLPSSLNDPVRNVSSTIVTPASISTYMRKKIRSAPNISFDDNAFSHTKGGKKRTSDEAAQRAKRRAINSSVGNLMDLETDAQRVIVLQETLQHPKMASIAKAVGYTLPEEVDNGSFQTEATKRSDRKSS